MLNKLLNFSATNIANPLQLLEPLDQLVVHQELEVLELVSGLETENKYRIRSSSNQDLFYAKEDSDFLSRFCCGSGRPFQMKVFDNDNRNEVIHFSRPLSCSCCCFPCCLNTLEVSAPPGSVIGMVKQKWSIYPSFVIENASGEIVYTIEGPFCTCSCCGADVEFIITSAHGKSTVGKIAKHWSGFVKEFESDMDNFGITFPKEIDVNMKVVLLGACFLIDYMYFEESD